jgi:hypothetical protein
MELGGEVSIGGHLAARLIDIDQQSGMHIRGFEMSLNGIAGIRGGEEFMWPKGSDNYDYGSGGIKVKMPGIYEIEGQCPFCVGFGETMKEHESYTDLLVNGEVKASTRHAWFISRAGANYAHSGVGTVGGQILKAVVDLKGGETISMCGKGPDADIVQMKSGRINIPIAAALNGASFLTVKMLMSAKADSGGSVSLPPPPSGGGDDDDDNKPTNDNDILKDIKAMLESLDKRITALEEK